MNIRHWAAPDHTRVVFDTSEESQYTLEKTDESVIIDFTDTFLAPAVPLEILLKKPHPGKVSLTIFPDHHIRVQISFPPNVSTNIFKLKKVQDKPDRLVIDLMLPDIERQETQEREQIKVSGKAKVIIIDPGHGGEDPGAVGKNGTLEKDVVLSIGKYLRDILNKKRGYQAFMTRDGDYYVSFKKRTTIAREYGADLFISIHADAAANRYARGSSVYCLSVKGASSEAAKILARNENLADLVGGSPNGESIEESEAIVLNMFQTNTINVSKTFGYNVLRHLGGISHLKFNTVQEAPFRVLKLPEIPSLLVETAYISNPQEEKLLRTRKFQKALAEAISRSIIEFLSRQPSTAPVIELVRDIDVKTEQRDDDAETKGPPTPMPKMVSTNQHRIYVVSRGDSLSKIAQDHNTTIEKLLKINDMTLNDVLFVGRRLKVLVPAEGLESVREDSPPAAPIKSEALKSTVVTTYKVKNGDSLDKIARRHGTTIGALLKLNDMRLHDALYVGRTLKLHEPQAVLKKASEANKPAAEAKREKVNSLALTTYQVKNGDSLDKIARRHGITLNALLKLNDMKIKDPLYVGRMIKISGTARADAEVSQQASSQRRNRVTMPAKKNDVLTYKVKKGDSIEVIARRHNVSPNEILSLNNMRRSDLLLYDQKLKIPQQPTF
jgi:N-acetylmuramoyl-L-alanine amidase